MGKSGSWFWSFHMAQCLFLQNRDLFPCWLFPCSAQGQGLGQTSLASISSYHTAGLWSGLYDPTALVKPMTTINLLAGKVTAWQQSKEKAEVSIVEECFYLTLSWRGQGGWWNFIRVCDGIQRPCRLNPSILSPKCLITHFCKKNNLSKNMKKNHLKQTPFFYLNSAFSILLKF